MSSEVTAKKFDLNSLTSGTKMVQLGIKDPATCLPMGQTAFPAGRVSTSVARSSRTSSMDEMNMTCHCYAPGKAATRPQLPPSRSSAPTQGGVKAKMDERSWLCNAVLAMFVITFILVIYGSKRRNAKNTGGETGKDKSVLQLALELPYDMFLAVVNSIDDIENYPSVIGKLKSNMIRAMNSTFFIPRFRLRRHLLHHSPGRHLFLSAEEVWQLSPAKVH
jgi:hypothetical protein